MSEKFHSESVQGVLSKAPPWGVRWGVTIVFIVLVAIIFFSYFIKSPDIVKGNVRFFFDKSSTKVISTSDMDVIHEKSIRNYNSKVDTSYILLGETRSQSRSIITHMKRQVISREDCNENYNIKIADKIECIVSEQTTKIIGYLEISLKDFEKVRVGQSVNIKLEGYPYMEFGVLSGTITSLSAVPEKLQSTTCTNIIYLAEVSLPHELTLSYNKELPMIEEMNGTVEVITKDMRLIARFFNPIMSLFKNI